ncbi:DUF1127 domain-containing protein [Bradyrhizobium liaoningense]|uniref:DUF1127 domain-containing protein n=1 Tax=Bradyrhizobium liaoningense TaxID=43992 RepID=UPI001BACDDED|nr:DUF1127 domain-containing protein [Bradyrhizobium liaoningense]
MLEQQLPSSVSRIVRPSQRRSGVNAHGLVLPGDRGDMARATRDMSKYTGPSAVVLSADTERPATAWWWVALAFFMEGFAVYGASMHPIAVFPVDEASDSANPHQARPAGNQHPAVAHEQGASHALNGSNIIAPGVAAWAEQRPRDRGNRLAGLGEQIMALWMYWRREQEIRRAVTALAQYDDRTLRDLGIQGRADIERMVRYCHDC